MLLQQDNIILSHLQLSLVQMCKDDPRSGLHLFISPARGSVATCCQSLGPRMAHVTILARGILRM